MGRLVGGIQRDNRSRLYQVTSIGMQRMVEKLHHFHSAGEKLEKKKQIGARPFILNISGGFLYHRSSSFVAFLQCFEKSARM